MEGEIWVRGGARAPRARACEPMVTAESKKKEPHHPHGFEGRARRRGHRRRGGLGAHRRGDRRLARVRHLPPPVGRPGWQRPRLPSRRFFMLTHLARRAACRRGRIRIESDSAFNHARAIEKRSPGGTAHASARVSGGGGVGEWSQRRARGLHGDVLGTARAVGVELWRGWRVGGDQGRGEGGGRGLNVRERGGHAEARAARRRVVALMCARDRRGRDRRGRRRPGRDADLLPVPSRPLLSLSLVSFSSRTPHG